MAKTGTLTVDLEMRTAAFEAAIKKSTATLNSNVASMKRSMDSLTSTANLIQGAIAGWAGSQAVGAVVHLVQAFGEAQQAGLQLNGVLESTGRYSDAAAEAINNNATALSRLTTFDDDPIVAATATFGQFAKKLSGPELAEAEKAIIGLSSAMKQDLESSAKQLGKTVSGATDTIGRSGITISKTTDQSARLNEVLQKTGSFFAVAQAEAQGVDGRVQQLNVSWGNLQEALGGVIADGLDLNNTLSDTSGMVNGLTDVVNNNRDTLARWIGFFRNLVGVVLNGVSIVATEIAGLVNSLGFTLTNITTGTLKVVNVLISGMTTAINTFVGSVINPLLSQVNTITKGASGNFKLPTFSAPQIPLGGANAAVAAMSKINDQLERGLATFKTGLATSFTNILKGNPYSKTTRGGTAAPNVDDDDKKGGKGKTSAANKKLAQEMAQLKNQADSLKESILSPWEKYEEEIAKATILLNKHLITQAQFLKYKDKMAEPLAMKFVGAPKLADPDTDGAANKITDLLESQMKSWQDEMDKGTEMTKSMRTAAEQLADTQAGIQTLFDEGAISLETYGRAMQKAQADSNSLSSTSDTMVQAIGHQFAEFGNKFFDTFVSSLKSGKFEFKSFVASALEDLGKLIFQLTVIDPLITGLFGDGKLNATTGAKNTGLLGGLIGQGSSWLTKSISSFISGHFADGGQPAVNQVSLVGERGPELFVPKVAGTVIPNNQLGNLGGGNGGGTTISYSPTIQVTTGVQSTVRAEIAQMMPAISAQIQKDFIKSIGRGGAMAHAVGRKS